MLVVGVVDVVVPAAGGLIVVPVGVLTVGDPDEPQPDPVVDVPESEEPLPDGLELWPELELDGDAVLVGAEGVVDDEPHDGSPPVGCSTVGSVWV